MINLKDGQIVTDVLTGFCCLLSDGFFQIMYIASFKFNLNGVMAE